METKEKILYAALDLFSEEGYEAVTVERIANAVGIKAPSLYKHYRSKQEIFDSLLSMTARLYEERSVFAKTDWTDPSQDKSAFLELTSADEAEGVIKMIRYLVHDPVISKTRKMLTVEQFRNPQIAAEQERRAYTDIFNFHRGLMQYFMDNGIYEQGDADVLALQYLAPISLELYRIDRNPLIEEEAVEMIRRHVIRFNSIYRKE